MSKLWKRTILNALTAISFTLAGIAQSAPKAVEVPDYSGMYTFLKEGEFLQLSIEDNGSVTGFISRYKDDAASEDSDKSFVDHFFKQAKLNGKNLTFTTEFAQNISYEFKGLIERGEGKTPQDEGYYVLKGSLTQHVVEEDKRTTATARSVTFKSFPEDFGAEPPK